MGQYTSLFAEPLQDAASPVPDARVPRYQILLVDDEPNVLNALRRVFRLENYGILTAGDGTEALEVLRTEPCQLVISDYMMPAMNGAELLRRIKETHPDVIRIMLTGHADTAAVMGAVKEGAVYKFILKPWNDDDLRITTALALEQHDLLAKNRSLRAENARSAKEIEALSKLAVTNRSQLAIMLNKRGLLNDQQVQELYKQQQLQKEPVLRIILARDWVSERRIREILRRDLLMEEVDLGEFHVDQALTELLPRSFCERHWVLPLKLASRRLTLVMADPMDMGLLDDMRFATGFEIQTVMASSADIVAKITEIYGESTIPWEDLETVVGEDDPYEGIEIVIEDQEDVSLEELLRGTDEPPAIRLVNVIILEASRLGASDIHIHPRAKSVVVRYRIDGVLMDKIQVPHTLHRSLVARIKVMAELDITERRRPQDGRITVRTPTRMVDLRISTLPTVNGEKVVMRMLDRNAAVQPLEALGIGESDLAKLTNVVERPQGIILATGPTGSGKTTTLYSMLQRNPTTEKNYVTIEDPVEYYLDMAGQVMVREKIGLDFAMVLRAILRQDPDVILLGEIRDLETAEVAFHAALTGHLVYSTLHTNSAVATVVRLLDMGLKPYVLATALEAIVAQRLVRRICDHCREPVQPDPRLLARLGPAFGDGSTQFFAGRGCGRCNHTGYRGRVGLYEVLVPTDDLRALIANGASVLELGQTANVQGFTGLYEDARDKVIAGLTTTAEILRVLGPPARM